MYCYVCTAQFWTTDLKNCLAHGVYKRIIQASHSARGSSDAEISAGYTIWHSIDPQVASFHHCGGGYTGSGDWRQHGDVQRHSLRADEIVALSESGPTTACVAAPGQRSRQSLLHAGFFGLEATGRVAGRNGSPRLLAIQYQ